jgi:hypothetical protein
MIVYNRRACDQILGLLIDATAELMCITKLALSNADPKLVLRHPWSDGMFGLRSAMECSREVVPCNGRTYMHRERRKAMQWHLFTIALLFIVMKPDLRTKPAEL